MLTSEQTSLLSEVRQKPIPKSVLVELESRLKHRIHSMVLDAFNRSGLSQKELAKRLGWDEARVSRCLGTSANWTLRTISALLTAIGVDLDDPSYTSFDELERRLKAQALALSQSRSHGRRSRAYSLSTIQLELGLARPAAHFGANETLIAGIPTGAFYDLLETPRPQSEYRKVVHLLKYRQETLGQNQNNSSQIGETNAQQKQA
jgi:transcriptional regulator with XRE-family HTH domain